MVTAQLMCAFVFVYAKSRFSQDMACDLFSGFEFIQGYGWFIVLGVIVFLYIRSKLSPTIEKYRQQVEDGRAARDYGTLLFSFVSVYSF